MSGMRWKLQEYELGIFVFNVMGGAGVLLVRG